MHPPLRTALASHPRSALELGWFDPADRLGRLRRLPRGPRAGHSALCSAESRGSGQRLELGRLKSGHSHRPAMFQWQYRATSNAGLRLVAIYTNGEQGGHHETSHRNSPLTEVFAPQRKRAVEGKALGDDYRVVLLWAIQGTMLCSKRAAHIIILFNLCLQGLLYSVRL